MVQKIYAITSPFSTADSSFSSSHLPVQTRILFPPDQHRSVAAPAFPGGDMSVLAPPKRENSIEIEIILGVTKPILRAPTTSIET